MRRRSNKTTRIILWVISILVIASMLCGVIAALFAPDAGFGMLPGILLGGLLV